MKIDNFLNEMFPGDASRGFLSFGDLGIKLELWMAAQTVQAITEGLDQLDLNAETDVNDVLRMLRRIDPQATQVFLDAALETYFSAPQIGQMLNGGMRTLFPNTRALPDIETELLLPVMERQDEGSHRE